jgi:hypothetical protein
LRLNPDIYVKIKFYARKQGTYARKFRYMRENKVLMRENSDICAKTEYLCAKINYMRKNQADASQIPTTQINEAWTEFAVKFEINLY